MGSTPGVVRESPDRVVNGLLERRLKEYVKADRRWLELALELKRIGGEETQIVPVPESDLGFLLANGHDMYANRVRLIRGGKPCHCHENAALLWVAGDADAIGMGWALSEDGLWRQHSWGIKNLPRSKQVLETTVKRVRYWGVELEGKWGYLAARPYLEAARELEDAENRLKEYRKKYGHES